MYSVPEHKITAVKDIFYKLQLGKSYNNGRIFGLSAFKIISHAIVNTGENDGTYGI